ncbi:hypothetical protein Ancab_039738 [Ancistrocladus abbreviatus]
MVGANFMEEIDCGSFFDHIDDLLEFPCEDFESGVDGNGSGGTGCEAFVWPNSNSNSNSNKASSEGFAASDSVFKANNSNTTSDLSAELSVPYEDIVQLEWLSTFVEDSFSGGGMTIEKENSYFTKDFSLNQFQSLSPVSVLESSSSCSNGKTMSLSHEKRARSKRPRPATFNPRPAIQLMSPASSVTENPQPFLIPNASSESEGFAESRPLKKVPKPSPAEHKNKKKIKILLPSCTGQINQSQTANPNPAPTQAARRCMHCEVTKTPQWRAGPMGPKTLCNACGVRYKSGRLYPEYRPAASPTFVPLLHSNSHKKVIEMRNRIITENSAMSVPASATAAAATTSSQTELIPRSSLLPSYV